MCGWKEWFNSKPPPPATPADLTPLPDVVEALARTEQAIVESREQLSEIQERRARLERIRRDNHFAPAIYSAFKGKR